MTNLHYILGFLALSWIPVSANAESGTGKGFDCVFQVSRGKLEHVSVWYGSLKPGYGASAKVKDGSYVLLSGWEGQKGQPNLVVRDKWPENFTINYFGPGRTGLATSVMSAWGEDGQSEDLPAEIALLASENSASDGEIKAKKRYKGLCSVNNSVGYETFIAGLQP